METGRGIYHRNGQFELACAYVFDGWLPSDPRLVKEIQVNLCSGRYDHDRSKLISDLRRDFSLIMYCLRRLAEEARGESIDPDELLRTSPLEKFGRILDSSSGHLQHHRLDQATGAPVQVLSRAMVSASVAQTLATERGLSPNLAFLCGLLRELGVALIAWNYPHVYARVVAALHPDESIDQALNARLGFSPTLLGVTIGRLWSLCPQIRFALGDPNACDDLDEESIEAARALEEICQTGETLARAAWPDMPQPRSDWRTAAAELERRMGSERFQLLKSLIRENLSNYLRAAPELYKLPALAVEDAGRKDQASACGGVRNRYVQYCPSAVFSPFRDFYEGLEGKKLQRDLVEILTKEIIPALGFKKGCVYLVDPEALTLAPRLLLGSASSGDYQALAYTTYPMRDNPVVAAFRSAVPIIEERDLRTDGPASYIAGALGFLRRTGVLYLELGENLLRDPGANSLVYFKAVREAFNDCLNASE